MMSKAELGKLTVIQGVVDGGIQGKAGGCGNLASVAGKKSEENGEGTGCRRPSMPAG
jgi:hypothetical protein